MRTTILLLCLTLAGCAGANAAHTSFAPEPASAAQASSSAPADAVAEASDPPPLPGPMGQPAPRRKGKKAGHAQKDSQDDSWWQEGGITREKINAMCWMKYENGHKDLPLDKRADLVDDCVQKTLKEHPLR